MPRPKAEDPKVQRNVYPPTSLWEAIDVHAKAHGMRTGELFVGLAAEGLKLLDQGLFKIQKAPDDASNPG